MSERQSCKVAKGRDPVCPAQLQCIWPTCQMCYLNYTHFNWSHVPKDIRISVTDILRGKKCTYKKKEKHVEALKKTVANETVKSNARTQKDFYCQTIPLIKLYVSTL